MRQGFPICAAAILLLVPITALSASPQPHILALPAAGPRFQVASTSITNGNWTDIEIRAEKLDGTWVSCWSETPYGSLISTNIADLDQDGRPEVVLVVQMPGSGAYKTILVLEWLRGGFERRELPERAGMEGFMGHESVRLTDDGLVVRYPYYEFEDANCCPSGGFVDLVHELRGDGMVIVGRERRENADSAADASD